MNATLPSKTSLKTYQTALTALEVHHQLTAQSSSLRTERFDLGQRLSQLQRKARNLLDALGGYDRASDRYAEEIEGLHDELAQVTEEIDGITKRDTTSAAELMETEQRLTTPASGVTPAVLKIHRDRLVSERDRLHKLLEHRDRVRVATDGGGLTALETEWQDLLARQMVGEAVEPRLAAVTAQLAQQQAAQASQDASNSSALAGLERMITAAETSLDTLEHQHQGLSGLFWMEQIGPATEDYEHLAAQTASALMRVQAMVTLLGDYDPTMKAGLDLSQLHRALLPSLSGGTNWLDYDNHLAPYCDRQTDYKNTLKAAEEGANE